MDCWKKYGILYYGIITGMIWSLWHLPMFFVEGTYQNNLIFDGAIPIISFFLSTVALGVIIGLTNKTGSILVSVLFHLIQNLNGQLITLTPIANLIYTIILIIIAFVVVYLVMTKET